MRELVGRGDQFVIIFFFGDVRELVGRGDQFEFLFIFFYCDLNLELVRVCHFSFIFRYSL